MLMPDVNILIYAHRAESREHGRYSAWLAELAESPEPFAVSELVVHGFLRIVTDRRAFDPPSTMEEALGFVDSLLRQPGCRTVRPGPEHMRILRRLCEGRRIRGRHIADAVHAAVAIECGCEWVSADTDFAHFAPLLRWKHL